MFTLPSRTFSQVATLAAILFLGAATLSASADRYTVYVVSQTPSDSFYGIDSRADFTINVSAGSFAACGGMQFNPCYETFYFNRAQPVLSTAPPALAWNNGSPCTPVVSPGMDPLKAVCNNGHEIFGGYYFPPVPNPSLPNDGELQGVWTGPNVTTDYLGPESFDGGFINSRGDAVFIDGLDDDLIFALDDTTSAVPEPASLILLATGCLSSLVLSRRRR